MGMKIFGFWGAFLLMHLTQKSNGQGMHFSQYYNAPLLINPANTGLTPNSDFRLGANYRKQWSSIPVPYRTISAFADFQAFRNLNETNWMGLGLAFFNDQAGVGNLSLSKIEGFLAYHVQMGDYFMISGGASAGYGSRSVDMSKFTYDLQWDGFTFNSDLPTSEIEGIQKTNYLDLGAGLNFALFPNENVYIKLGIGLSHINQPQETFLGYQNKLGLRPTVNLDALFKLGEKLSVNPSAYYSQEKGAYEALYGLLFSSAFSASEDVGALYLGVYHRLNDAVVPVVGMGFNDTRLMFSYDFTISNLSIYNRSSGAFEVSLNYEGIYGEGAHSRRTYHCPRF